jgi:hypothetical protein
MSIRDIHSEILWRRVGSKIGRREKMQVFVEHNAVQPEGRRSILILGRNIN